MRYDFLMAAILFAMGSFMFITVVFALTRRELLLGFVLLSLLALANGIFSVSYGGFILSDTESSMLIFTHFSYIAAPFISLIWFLISIQQRTKVRMLPMQKYWPFLVVPVLVLCASLMYPWGPSTGTVWFQRLFFVSHSMETSASIGSGFSTLIFEKGSLYFIMTAYDALLFLGAAINYYDTFQKTESVHRRDILILLITSLVAFGFLVYTLSSSNTALIGILPFASVAITILAMACLYKYEFFDLIPFAYRQLFQSVSVPIFIFDKSMTVISANDTAKKYYGNIFNFRELMNIQDFNRIDSNFRDDLIKKGEHETFVNTNGDTRYFNARFEVLKQDGKQSFGYLLQYVDITDHKKELARMENAATYDDLTKIFNRRVFYLKAASAFDEAVLKKEDFSFVMFDLDEFKEINDIYGHQAGDFILEKMAELFTNMLDHTDIFARYGGEEFIIFCRNKAPEEAAGLAEKMRQELDVHIFEYNGRKIKTSASFGVSGSSGVVKKSFERYIKDSDDGLYLSKSKGKNKVEIVL